MAAGAPQSNLVWRLSPDDAAKLRELGGTHDYAAGEALVREGEPLDHAIVILRGHVKITSAGRDGREILLARRGRNAVVGEFAALDHLKRSARVVAETDVHARLVSSRDFERFLRSHPDATYNLLLTAIASLRRADFQLEVGTRKVLCRVIRVLLDWADQQGGQARRGRPVEVRIRREDLAGWIGASLSATDKAVRKLRDKQIITTGRLRIVVQNVEALRRLEE